MPTTCLATYEPHNPWVARHHVVIEARVAGFADEEIARVLRRHVASDLHARHDGTPEPRGFGVLDFSSSLRADNWGVACVLDEQAAQVCPG